jgi:hypothetical protein
MIRAKPSKEDISTIIILLKAIPIIVVTGVVLYILYGVKLLKSKLL